MLTSADFGERTGSIRSKKMTRFCASTLVTCGCLSCIFLEFSCNLNGHFTILITYTLEMSQVITDAYKTVVRHYKEGNLNWPMIIYISLAHIAAVIGLLSIGHCSKYTLLWAFILWPISGVGITGGVHRLWAHRSYKATFPLRVYLMLSNSIANQGSIWHWSRDHRVHHKHSEVCH